MTERVDMNDLDGQAYAIWRIGNELCGDCGTYHKLRGILLKAGGLHGGNYDAATLAPFFRRLIFPGARVLIAGSADAGLLRTVLDCVEARPLAITILDLCPTPLTLIDRLQPVPDVSISTQVADLTRPLEMGGFDMIVSHSMLPFVPWERRGLVLDSLRSALAPGGRLIVSASVGDGMTAGNRRTARQAWLSKVLEAVDDLPEMVALLGGEKQELLRDYAERFRYTDDAFATVDQIASLLEAHGLEIDEQGHGPDRPAVGFATPGRRSAIFVSHARTV